MIISNIITTRALFTSNYTILDYNKRTHTYITNVPYYTYAAAEVKHSAAGSLHPNSQLGICNLVMSQRKLKAVEFVFGDYLRHSRVTLILHW